MTELFFFKSTLYAWFAFGAPIFFLLFFIKVPYGRYSRPGWGPLVNKQLAWILMEAPAFIGFLILFIIGDSPKTFLLWFFFLLWEAHYLHRAFIYPFQLRGTEKKVSLSVIIFSVAFNLINCYLNGRWLFHFSEGYSQRWFLDIRFLLGIAIFIIGFIINRHSDLQLQKLRKRGENTYKLPKGGIFDYVASPNYFGEIVEWSGWALATWSLAGLSFAFWTAVNLAPRAWSHLQWYRENFSDYPKKRKALLPWIF